MEDNVGTLHDDPRVGFTKSLQIYEPRCNNDI